MKVEDDCVSKTEELCSPSTCLRTKLIAWIAVLAWMVVIYLFSAQPYSGAVTGKYLGDANIPIRKLAHVTEYAILLILSRRAIAVSFETGVLSRFPGVGALIISALYALSDEWHQSFVPGRSATLSDAMVDTSGALIGLTLLTVFFKLRGLRGTPAKD